MSYTTRLRARMAEAGRPIRVGLAGAGQMGSGFVAQVQRIDGLDVAAIADVDPQRAIKAYGAAGVVEVSDGSTGDMAELLDGGGHLVVTAAAMLADLAVDMVIDATGVPDVGAQLSLAALRSGKDVGLLNVECDVTIGLLLAELARRRGLVYTVCRGDEPAEARRLVDFALDLSFEVICAGKGKNNPLDPTATPESLRAEAAEKRMNPKMLCSFVDGSKAMIEMAALANATGLQVSRRGMYGPSASVAGLAQVFALREDGGVLDRPGVVDYCTGDVAPGVFVVVRSDNAVVLEEMCYLKMGTGPYFAFYRPYHLASIEAPLTIGEAALDRTPSLQPRHWVAEVAAAAKRNLTPGDVIDGIGGSTVYGVIEDAAVFAEQGLTPLGLLAGARLLRAVPQGQLLTRADVEIDEECTIARLRVLQEQWMSGTLSADDLETAVAAVV